MPRKPYLYHFIYRTTNTITGKFYVGMHSTNDLADGYLGSGKRLKYSLNKYGKENHRIEILEFCKNRDELQLKEESIVNEELLSNPLCMNLCVGGIGGVGGYESKRFTGGKHTEEAKRKISEANKKNIGEKNPMYGKTHSDEFKKRISDIHLGNTYTKGKKYEDTSKYKEAGAKLKRPVIIDDVEYPSILEAAESVGIPRSTLWNRINSKSKKYLKVFFKDEPKEASGL